jgi:hypothetical protein
MDYIADVSKVMLSHLPAGGVSLRMKTGCFFETSTTTPTFTIFNRISTELA